jgi:hypothetical protein
MPELGLVHRRSATLASGRFAILDNGSGFAIVPWRRVIEQALGRTITAVVRTGNIDWQVGRQRELAI